MHSAWKANCRHGAEYLPRIAHIQLADNPGRNEPGTGEINYAFLFRHLDAIGLRRLDRLRVQAPHHDGRGPWAGSRH